jgi:hypothetical protein
MKRQPSTGWYWVAGIVALAGVIAGIVLGLTTFLSYQDDLREMARDAGGEVRVTLTTDQDAVVFLEGPGVADNKDLRPTVAVTGPEGDDLTVESYDAELLYDVPGRQGETGRAIATFDVTASGVHTVSADTPDDTTIAVGAGLNFATLTQFVAALALPALAVLLAIGMAVSVAIMRRSQPPTNTPPQQPRVPAGV